jgi:hypothetical protein
MNPKALMGLLVVVLAGYAAFLFIPPYFNYYQFTDDVNTMAKFAAVNRQDEEQMRTDLMKKVREYDLPVKPEQIKIVRTEKGANITVDYQVVVDVAGQKQVPLDFHVQSK